MAARAPLRVTVADSAWELPALVIPDSLALRVPETQLSRSCCRFLHLRCQPVSQDVRATEHVKKMARVSAGKDGSVPCVRMVIKQMLSVLAIAQAMENVCMASVAVMVGIMGLAAR